jgi:hypothetical protein
MDPVLHSLLLKRGNVHLAIGHGRRTELSEHSQAVSRDAFILAASELALRTVRNVRCVKRTEDAPNNCQSAEHWWCMVTLFRVASVSDRLLPFLTLINSRFKRVFKWEEVSDEE